MNNTTIVLYHIFYKIKRKEWAEVTSAHMVITMYISMLNKVQTSLNNFYDALNSIIHLDFNIKSNRLILCTSDQKVKDLNDLFQYHLKSLLLQSVHNKQTVPIINKLQDISLHINERVNHYSSLCKEFTDRSFLVLYMI